MPSPMFDNPVMRAELSYQRRVITTSRSGRFWIGLALLLLIPAFIAALLFVCAALTGVDVSGLSGNANSYSLIVHLIIMNVALYVVVTLVTMGLASNSIRREQTGKTWESLLLTGIPTRQIIRGKWWATLRALWGDHVMVGVLRAGLLAWVAIEFSLVNSGTPQPDRLSFVIGLLFVAAFTAVEAGFSAALAIIAPLMDASGALLILILGLRAVASAAIFALIQALHGALATFDGSEVVAGLIGLAVLMLITLAALRLAEAAATALPIAFRHHRVSI